jgi:hypothetical protein
MGRAIVTGQPATVYQISIIEGHCLYKYGPYYLLHIHIKEDEMGGAYSMYERFEKCM